MRWTARVLLIFPITVAFLIASFNVRAADGTPPITTTTLTGNLGNNGWYTSTVAVDIASDDLESGVQSITYNLDGAQTVQSFTSGVNVLPNPSFEAGAVTGWVVSGSATFSQDFQTAKFDTNSVKIVSSNVGYKDWQTQNGILLTSGHNYTLSVWVKYSSVLGNGVKLLLDTSASPSLTGTQGNWVRLQLSYSPLITGSYFPKLGIDGPGTVNFDGAVLSEQPLSPEVGFVVSSNGSHSLSYFATNNDGVAEAPRNINFKLDTQGPANWRNFQQIDGGNDHTFSFNITVDDSLSGLATPTGQYQYSLDGGTTWGHHSDVTKCNSPWIADEFLATTQNPSGSGAVSTTMSTPNIDFCNSDFSGCNKKFRFQIQDVAGNTSSRDQCLNSAWFQTQGGDIHSVGNIAPSSISTADYLVSSAGSISNLTSAKNWLLSYYPLGLAASQLYTDWRSKYYATSLALPGGKLPGSGSGYYKVTSNFTIDSGTLPAGVATSDVSAVIFFDGNLSVYYDFAMKPTSAYVFVVSGDVLVDGGVKNMAGLYFSQGKFDDHNGGPGNNQLTVNGSSWAMGGYDLNRDLGKSTNSTTPADKFILSTAIFGNAALANLLAGSLRLRWIELAP